MKIYIGILFITLCVIQVSDGKPPRGQHGNGGLGSNDIYATVNKPPRGHGPHHHGGPPGDPNDLIYADIQHRPPDDDPIYENTQGHTPHRNHGPNDPETLYAEVAGPGHGPHGYGGHRGGGHHGGGHHGGGHHGGGHHGGGHHGGGHHGGNHIGDPDDDNEPTHGHLPFQTRGHGPPLPPRPPGGHPDPNSRHPGHSGVVHRRNAIKR